MKIVLIIIAIILLGLAGFGGYKWYQAKPDETISTSQQPAEEVLIEENDSNDNAIVVTESKVQEFDMTVSQFTYDPATIVVDEGDTVVLRITSTDVPHSFTLPDFGSASEGGINEFLSPGETVTVEFVADKAGEFVFGCDVVCGTGHTDMLGKLIVK